MDKANEPDPVAAANSAVTAAQQILDELIAQRGAVTVREKQLTGERAKIAFAAHGAGNAKAKTRLSTIHREFAEIGSEIAGFDAAIEEAKARLAAAKLRVGQEIERQRAREAIARGEAVQAAAAGCDTALRQFLQAYDALDRACAAACGITSRPSRQVVRVAAKRALIAALTARRLDFDTELLAPNERHTFAEIAQAWHNSITAWAAQRLAEPGQPPEEEQAA
jgi:chromosome segregation ATPase